MAFLVGLLVVLEALDELVGPVEVGVGFDAEPVFLRLVGDCDSDGPVRGGFI